MKPIIQTNKDSHHGVTATPKSKHRKCAQKLARQTSRLMLAVGMALYTVSAGAQSPQPWTSVDDFPSATANGIATDAVGNIFVAGSAQDASGRSHAVVMKSSDHGQTWDNNPWTLDVEEPSDDFISADGSGAAYGAIASWIVIATGENHLVATGSAGARWLVRRSTDAGFSWATLDLFTHPNPKYALSGNSPGAAVDSSGNIYVIRQAKETIVTGTGKKTTTSYAYHWLIRKRNAAGVWSMTDIPFPASAGSCEPNGIACVGNDVFVVGYGGNWHVRKSSDGGATWPPVDNFSFDASGGANALGVAADNAGNVFVVGVWPASFGGCGEVLFARASAHSGGDRFHDGGSIR